MQAPNALENVNAYAEEIHINDDAIFNSALNEMNTSHKATNLITNQCDSTNEIITSNSPNGKVTCTVHSSSTNITVQNVNPDPPSYDDISHNERRVEENRNSNNNENEDSSVTMNVTISLVNRTISTSSATDVTSDSAITATINGSTVTPISSVSSTCTIGKNGLIVEELDEVKSVTPAPLVDIDSLQESPKSVVMISSHHEPTAAEPVTTEESEYSNRNHNHTRSSSGDNKENHHCTLLAMNGYHNGHHHNHNHNHHHLHQNGGAVADQFFPDAPTTPKVLRKVAPMYCTFNNSNNGNGGSSGGGIKRISSSSVTSSTTSTEDSVVSVDMPPEVTSTSSCSTSSSVTGNGSVTVTLTVNGDDRHASTTRIHICPPD